MLLSMYRHADDDRPCLLGNNSGEADVLSYLQRRREPWL